MKVVKAFAAQGYDILCETPMATSIELCLQIEAAVKKAGIVFGLRHCTVCLLFHACPPSHDA